MAGRWADDLLGFREGTFIKLSLLTLLHVSLLPVKLPFDYVIAIVHLALHTTSGLLFRTVSHFPGVLLLSPFHSEGHCIKLSWFASGVS